MEREALPNDIRYTHQRLDASTASADGRARSMLPLLARASLTAEISASDAITSACEPS